MTEQSLTRELNEFADALNEAATKLGSITKLAKHVPRVEPGSPLATLAEQAKRFAAMMPEPTEPTTWEPSGWPD